MINKALYSSASEEWATPVNLFRQLDKLYNFTLDPCATVENAKCKKFYTKEDDGLIQSWTNERVFCNPPYGNGIDKWLAKATQEPVELALFLIPARTDTKRRRHETNSKKSS